MTFSNSDSDSNKISLLEEKLQVTRHKQKVGEIIVRKEVETKIVELPIRREKLIVERIGKNPERLTETVINEENVNGFGYSELDSDKNSLHVVRSKHVTIKEAQNILNAINSFVTGDNYKICIEIVTTNPDMQQKYQDICDRNWGIGINIYQKVNEKFTQNRIALVVRVKSWLYQVALLEQLYTPNLSWEKCS